jgi:hypothetical protein
MIVSWVMAAANEIIILEKSQISTHFTSHSTSITI